MLNGSGVGVIIAAKTAMIRRANLRFLLRNLGETMPRRAKKAMISGISKTTPIQNIKDNFPDTETVEFDTYSQCVEALLDGQVDAVTTDQAILLGYASQDPDNLKVVGEPFTVERYGIGLAKGDETSRTAINEAITEMIASGAWQDAFDTYFGDTGFVPSPQNPPTVE